MFTKNEDEEMGGILERRKVTCDREDTTCANILIAVIPALRYETYDIYVHVRRIAQLSD